MQSLISALTRYLRSKQLWIFLGSLWQYLEFSENEKQNGKTESIYHSQGDPFDVLFVLDHYGKLGFSVNKCNTKMLP